MPRDETDARSGLLGASKRPAVPALRPLLPTIDRLLPYLSRIDATRCYTNWGPLVSELEERLARKLHLRDEAQPLVRLINHHTPEVDRIANGYCVRFTSSSPQADTPKNQINSSANIP